MFTIYVPGARESQKRVSDFLELELQKIVSYHMGAWIRTWMGPLQEQML